jgi:enoyl-CoA hydratase/carnithine racemase
LNEEMWIGLNDAFIKAKEDAEIRAVVITGEGRAFCEGDDIEMMYYWNSLNKALEWSQKNSW